MRQNIAMLLQGQHGRTDLLNWTGKLTGQSAPPGLPLSHHRLLQPLKDASVKMARARMAVKHSFSKRELECEIGRLIGSQTRSAKRALNMPVIKALSHLIEASENSVQAATAEDSELRRSTGREAHSFLQRLGVDLDAVHCLVEMLRARLQAGTGPPQGVSPGKQVPKLAVKSTTGRLTREGPTRFLLLLIAATASASTTACGR